MMLLLLSWRDEREYDVIMDNDVDFKNAKAMVWKQQDKERYGSSDVRGNGRKTWCEDILLLLLMTVIFVVV